MGPPAYIAVNGLSGVNGLQIRNRGFHPAFAGWIPFLAGFLTGLFFVILFSGQLVNKQIFWGLDAVSELRYLTVRKESLFFYVLGIRWRTVLLMIFFSVTILGKLFRIACTAWYGFCFGSMMMAASMYFHGKGILLVLAGLFPQILLYLPAYMLLCSMSRELYACACENRTGISVRTVGSRLLILALFVMGGCLAESYINPAVFAKVIKLF